MEILRNVSNHLWKYKTERGLSINQLAEELNLGRTTIYKCLHQTWNPTIPSLTYPAQQMGMPLEELLTPPDHSHLNQSDSSAVRLYLKRLLEELE